MGKEMSSKDEDDFLDDLEDLDDEEFGAEEWSSLSSANGFITAVILSPTLIDPAEWLPLLTGSSPEELTDEEAAATREMLTIQHRRVLDCLAARDSSYSPSFWEDEDGRLITKDWAEGFIAGMHLSEAAWDRLLRGRGSPRRSFPGVRSSGGRGVADGHRGGRRPQPGGMPSVCSSRASAGGAGLLRAVATRDTHDGKRLQGAGK